MNGISDLALDAAGSVWAYLVVALCAAFDAIIPMVPSESVVVALAAVSVDTGAPNLVLLALAAGLGAFVGDNTTFQIGRRVGLERFGWMRTRRMQKAWTMARRELDRRAAVLILTARYIPVGRAAVNLTAGATGYPTRRFVVLSAIAATSWAAYSVAVGVLAGSWVKAHPLYGALVAVVVAVCLGLVVDRVLSAWRRRVLAD